MEKCAVTLKGTEVLFTWKKCFIVMMECVCVSLIVGGERKREREKTFLPHDIFRNFSANQEGKQNAALWGGGQRGRGGSPRHPINLTPMDKTFQSECTLDWKVWGSSGKSHEQGYLLTAMNTFARLCLLSCSVPDIADRGKGHRVQESAWRYPSGQGNLEHASSIWELYPQPIPGRNKNPG